MPEPDVLTIHELAALLRVGLKTAYTLAQNGEVPGFKVGGPQRHPAERAGSASPGAGSGVPHPRRRPAP